MVPELEFETEDERLVLYLAVQFWVVKLYSKKQGRLIKAESFDNLYQAELHYNSLLGTLL